MCRAQGDADGMEAVDGVHGSLDAHTAELSCDAPEWYVMRDLKRRNARLPAYLQLGGMGFETFTPMGWRLSERRGRLLRELAPLMPDLVFVRGFRVAIDPVVERVPTLQYRYVRGGYKVPMTVGDAEMSRFIRAVESSDCPRYYRPDEITPGMRDRRIRIIGGALDGCEGTLVTTRGSKTKRLLVELPTLLAAAVEVRPEFITFL